MTFESIAAARHSVRVFLPDPVPQDVIRKCVRIAQSAPSWVNAQEWKVYVAQGETLEGIRREFIAKGAEQGHSDVPVAHRESWSEAAQKRMAAVGELLAAKGLAEAMGAVQAPLFNAPAVAFFTMPRNASSWAMLDMGGFYQTFMLALTAEGYGSIPAYAFVKFPEVVRKYLPITDDEQIVVGVGFGKPSDAPINSLREARPELDSILSIKG